MTKRVKLLIALLVVFLTFAALPFAVAAEELSGSDLKLVEFSSFSDA